MRGAGARLSIEAPLVTYPDHALAEVSLQWGEEGEEVVEIGWEVAPRKYGEEGPHLLVHRFLHGRACGDECALQPWSARLRAGMPLGAWTGAELAVGWLLWEGRAWAWADGEWLGYFDLSTSGPTPGRAMVAQWFGEVFFLQPPPRVSMGNGRAPQDPRAATISTVCDVPEEAAGCVVRSTRFPRVTRPESYRIDIAGPGALRYGGPGESDDPGLRPRPPPSSASGETPPATGR